MNIPLTITVPPLYALPSFPVLQRLRSRLFHLFADLIGEEKIAADASDEVLMEAYRKGNGTAFRMLFDRYAPRIHGAALKRGLSPSDAADAVQQTFIHVHQGRKEFKPGAPVRPWIYTVAFNVMRDAGRRFSSHRRLKEQFAAEPRTEDEQPQAPGTSGVALLRAALEKLSPAQREVLVLHYFEEMSFGEIARMLGSGEGAVRVRAHRAYEKLRDILPRVQPTGDAA